jgi:membrane-bound lytic murein transglycosylase A
LALAAFRRSCIVMETKPHAAPMGGAGYAGTVADWLPVCRALPGATASPASLREWFAAGFKPLAVAASSGTDGLFTGYYEPELAVSPVPISAFRTPLYGRPRDLVTADLGAFSPALEGRKIVGRVDGGTLLPYPDRAAIDHGALAGSASILFYAQDAIAVFFLQIQGSGIAHLPDGSRVRLDYDGDNGRRFTPIGRVLIRMGAMARKDVSLQSIRTWLMAHPQSAQSLMEQDRSYVFFRKAPLGDRATGSPGSEGANLTPEASLAVDRSLHPLGMPVYVSTALPALDASHPAEPFERLLVAQDTGGAIRGAVRGDVYFGSGAGAEALAGHMKSPGRMFVLVPKAVAERLAPYKDFSGPPP